jgi:hypothetical protein
MEIVRLPPHGVVSWAAIDHLIRPETGARSASEWSAVRILMGAPAGEGG